VEPPFGNSAHLWCNHRVSAVPFFTRIPLSRHRHAGRIVWLLDTPELTTTPDDRIGSGPNQRFAGFADAFIGFMKTGLTREKFSCRNRMQCFHQMLAGPAKRTQDRHELRTRSRLEIVFHQGCHRARRAEIDVAPVAGSFQPGDGRSEVNRAANRRPEMSGIGSRDRPARGGKQRNLWWKVAERAKYILKGPFHCVHPLRMETMADGQIHEIDPL